MALLFDECSFLPIKGEKKSNSRVAICKIQSGLCFGAGAAAVIAKSASERRQKMAGVRD